ncbi:MAG: S9 family peptidase [Bacteroidota bacterium]|nr:S9 family peptidase [Bacteroidota bacterium]
MKRKMAILGLSLCGLMTTLTLPAKSQGTNYIPPVQKLNSDIMTPEVLWSFGRVSEPEVSPDGKLLLYGVTYFNIPENKSYRDLYVVPIEGGQPRQITNTQEKEAGALWRPDGQKIGFLSAKSGDMQLWEIDPDGANARQVSSIKGGITGFKYSPDGQKILFTADVKLDQSVTDLFPDLPKANARLENDLMYRHWDSWSDYTYSHVFIANYNDGKLDEPKDLMPGERFDSPIKPNGGMEQINWSPDSKQIAYSCKKLAGKAYALSTNSEIYVYDLANGKTENVSKGCMGYDWNPVFSPDGKYLAWESMARDGYEADKTRIMIKDLATGTRKSYSDNFDQNATLMSWSKDSKTIYFISDWHATEDIYKFDLPSGKITKVTNGIHDYHNVKEAGKYLIAEKVSMSQPAEIYRVDPATGKDEPITTVNQNLLSQLTFGKVEKRWIKTTDGQNMLTWVIYPPHFDAKKKYPTLLYCEGGPQSTVSQFWSYRWNFQMMAANDYIIVAPNRRGLPGFGMKWLEQISKDYGGQNIKDYLSAIDAVSKEPYVDKDHLGCVGASYGGYSVYYLAGHHQKRFKAFIAHCGIFNFEAMYSTTEEMWFENWDMGGAYWDKKNLAAQRSYSFSPHKFVQNWDTPLLVITGGRDFRIPFTQGMGAYNSAQLKGIPSQFLFFPEESHWVLGAQNGILWQRVFFNWLDKWLKVDKK